MPREDPLPRYRDSDGAVGTALIAVAGFATGLLVGLVAGELTGALDPDRMRRAVRRMRGGSDTPRRDPAELARDLRAALRKAPLLDLKIDVVAVGPGLIELTGTAPNAVTRQAAGDFARQFPGVEVVVNRILVPGTDLPPRPLSPTA